MFRQKTNFFIYSLMAFFLIFLTTAEANAVSNSCVAGPYTVSVNVTNNLGTFDYEYQITGSPSSIRKISLATLTLDKIVPVNEIILPENSTTPPCQEDPHTGAAKGTCAVSTTAFTPQPGPDTSNATFLLQTTHNEQGEGTVGIKAGGAYYTCVEPGTTNGIIAPGVGDGVNPAGVFETASIFTPDPRSGNLCPAIIEKAPDGTCLEINLTGDAVPGCAVVPVNPEEFEIGGLQVEFFDTPNCSIIGGTTSDCYYIFWNGSYFGVGENCPIP